MAVFDPNRSADLLPCGVRLGTEKGTEKVAGTVLGKRCDSLKEKSESYKSVIG